MRNIDGRHVLPSGPVNTLPVVRSVIGPLGQLRCILAAAGRPGTPVTRPGIVGAGVGPAGEVAADSAGGEFVVELGDELVELGGVVAVGDGRVAADLGVCPQGQPVLLGLVRRRGGEVGFVLEVPAVAALLFPQGLCAFGAGRASVLESGAAGQELVVDLAGGLVGAAELDRADAPSGRLRSGPGSR